MNMGLQFHDVDFEIIDRDGNKWVTVKQTAHASEQSFRALLKLIQDLRRRGELKETVHFMFIVLPTATGPRKTMVLSYLGLTRIFMRSDAPRAQEFRDWAETVLGPVMTQGYYLPAEAETALVQKLTGMIDERIEKEAWAIHDKLAYLTNLVSQKMITSEPDISEWPTPAQRMAQLLAPVSLPAYFNRGGHFNWWVSEEHFKEFGGFLRQRSRRGIQKMPEYVIQPCPENDMFLRSVFKKYLKAFWPPEQGSLFPKISRRVKKDRRSRRIRRFTR